MIEVVALSEIYPSKSCRVVALVLFSMLFFQLAGCDNYIEDEYDNPVLHLQHEPYSLGASDAQAVMEKAMLYRRDSDKFFRPILKREGLSYQIQNLVLLVLKREKEIQLYTHQGSHWHYIVSIRIRALSGHAGPKLKQGDMQVPEGIYRIMDFNPHSHFHLSMGINYPNQFDVERARAEGRDNLGDDIYIHGNAVSAGCVAIGNAGINVLFPLAVELGVKRQVVIIAPYDFRVHSPGAQVSSANPWLQHLYSDLVRYMTLLPVPKRDHVVRFL